MPLLYPTDQMVYWAWNQISVTGNWATKLYLLKTVIWMIIVWFISNIQKTCIHLCTASLNNRIYSENQQYIFAEHLWPEGPVIVACEYIFQKDEATIHVSLSSKSLFTAKNNSLVDCQSESVVLYLTEHMERIIVQFT